MRPQLRRQLLLLVCIGIVDAGLQYVRPRLHRLHGQQQLRGSDDGRRQLGGVVRARIHRRELLLLV